MLRSSNLEGALLQGVRVLEQFEQWHDLVPLGHAEQASHRREAERPLHSLEDGDEPAVLAAEQRHMYEGSMSGPPLERMIDSADCGVYLGPGLFGAVDDEFVQGAAGA